MEGQLNRWYSGWPLRYPAWDLCCPCTCRRPEGAARQLRIALFIYLLALLVETAQLPRLLLSPSFFQEVPPTTPATKACQGFRGLHLGQTVQAEAVTMCPCLAQSDAHKRDNTLDDL